MLADLFKHSLDIGLEHQSPQVASYGDGTAGIVDFHDVDAGISGRALQPAVFLDRDGTLNRELAALTRPEQLELLEGAAGAVRRLNEAGYLTVVITNQSVVARGQVTLAELDRIHARLKELFGQHQASLDRIYACPHHPDLDLAGGVAELLGPCDCRKPATGSIDAACRDLGIDRDGSWLIGDTTSDIEAGQRAHLKTILVQSGQGGRDGRFPVQPDVVSADVAGAVSWILDGRTLRR